MVNKTAEIKNVRIVNKMKVGYIVAIGVVILLTFCALVKVLSDDNNDDDNTADQASVQVSEKINVCKTLTEDHNDGNLVKNYINNLQIDDKYCDVILTFSADHNIKVHKVIAAAYSETLEALILTRENKSDHNGLVEIELSPLNVNYETMSIVTKFMYNAKLPVDEVILDYELLLEASNILKISTLKCIIEKHLQTTITINNVGNLLVLAEQQRALHLKMATSIFFVKHLQEVLRTSQWKQVAANNPTMVTSVFDILGKKFNNSICAIECLPANMQSPIIYNQFKRFFLTGRFADAMIKTNDSRRTFHVNKAILMEQSPVFAHHFSGSTEIDMSDMDVNVVKEFLTYMYSGWTFQLGSVADRIILLADKYEMMPLKAECENLILSTLDVHNAARLIKVADLADSKRLSTKIVDFILKNINSVVNTPGWEELKVTHPEVLTRILTDA